MKVRNPILPLTVAPRRRRALLAALVSVLLTSILWAAVLHQERVTNDRLLAEKMAQQMRVDAIVVKYANGRSVAVTLKEQK